MKILVIEDDAAIRMLSKEILSDAGYEVDTAQNGDEGLRYLLTNKVDLIVTDLMMDGLSGIELLYALRKLKIPVITISGLSREVIIDELLSEMHVKGVLQKPFKEAELLDKVAMAVHR